MKIAPLKVWLMASRPKTLFAAVAPVIIGTAMAFGDNVVHWPSAILAGLCSVLIQIGTNFANDFYDFHKGADDEKRLGPTRVTQAGLVSHSVMKIATILVFSLAFIAGLYLVYRGGWPILMIGILSILFGILYTGGPYPLGYNGLGDIFVLIFFGFIAVSGTYYVQALHVTREVVIAGLAPGLFSTAILTVNNYRDIENDRKSGKRTLAVRFGANFAKMEYLFAIIIATLTPPILLYFDPQRTFVLLSSLTFLFAIPAIKTVLSQQPGILFNAVLAKTGQLLLIYSLLFALGWNL